MNLIQQDFCSNIEKAIFFLHVLFKLFNRTQSCLDWTPYDKIVPLATLKELAFSLLAYIGACGYFLGLFGLHWSKVTNREEKGIYLWGPTGKWSNRLSGTCIHKNDYTFPPYGL